jgi:4-hydroxy-tetrahydrodipicolinate synthase
VYPALEVGAVGAICTTANYAPGLVCSIYEKFIAGKKAEALELQYKLNPIRIMMDKSSFPVATKDYAGLLGHSLGNPYPPNLPSPPGQMEKLRQELKKAGLLQ